MDKSLQKFWFTFVGHSRKPLFILGIACLANSSWAQGSDEEALLGLYGDEEMISIATGTRQPIAKAPAVASVITAEDIRRMGATDLDDVLETIPGLHVARNHFYNPIYVIRGVYSTNNPQVLMLINGVSIGTLFQGDRGLVWGGMPVENISRIEVIRGPGSAVYGADAFAGVINIITKSAKEIDGVKTGIRAGSFSTIDGWWQYGGSWRDVEVAFSVEYNESDGADEIVPADNQTLFDFLFGTNVSYAPGPVYLQTQNLDTRLDLHYDNWRFRTGLQQRRDVGNGVGIFQAINPNNVSDADRYNADLTYNSGDDIENFEWELQLSHFRSSQELPRNLEVLPPGANFFGTGVYPDGVIGNPEGWERNSRAQLSALFTASSRHQFRGGLGFYRGDLYRVRESKNFGIDPSTGVPIPPGGPIVDVTDTPYVYLREDDRDNKYVFAQYIGKVADDWELTFGLRHDDYSDFGSTTNPRAALVWSATHKLTAKLLYGEAFRAPAFAETRAQNNPAVLGNPDLKPETMRSTELVFDYTVSEQLRFTFNIFDYVWDDIIDFYPIGGGGNQANNRGQQMGDGMELDLHWQLNSKWDLNANASIIDTETDVNGVSSNTANVPFKQFFIAVDYDFNQSWTAQLKSNWVLDRYREPGDPRSPIDDYNLTDISLSYRPIGKAWSVDFAVGNVFNVEAYEPNSSGSIPNDYPLADRHAYGTLRIEL